MKDYANNAAYARLMAFLAFELDECHEISKWVSRFDDNFDFLVRQVGLDAAENMLRDETSALREELEMAPFSILDMSPASRADREGIWYAFDRGPIWEKWDFEDFDYAVVGLQYGTWTCELVDFNGNQGDGEGNTPQEAIDDAYFEYVKLFSE